MIYYVPIGVLTATSIILLLLLYRMSKYRRALERELSSIRARSPELEIEKIKSEAMLEAERLKREALQEIQNLKDLEIKRLDEELSQKRFVNDAEIKQKEETIANILESYKKSGFEVIQNALDSAKVAAIEEHREFKISLQEELLSTRVQIELEKSNLDQFRRNQLAITDALRRKALEDDQFNIQLAHADRLEVEDLQTIATKYPRIRQILLKATYDIYYAPEVKKLVSRIVGAGRVSGIYRITCKVDGRLYIGKSVHIADRWVTHFKRACGVETETTNLLYPAMRKIGVENFSFEIIERDIPEDRLSEREKYWQQFYDAKTHGFSVR